MKSVDLEPLHVAPTAGALGEGDAEALVNALRGVDRGAWDDQTVELLSQRLDKVFLWTVVSWLERVRTAGVIEVLDLQVALQRRQLQARDIAAPSTEVVHDRPGDGRVVR